MEFRILGPLEVLDGQRPVSVNGPKPRAMLAVLLLHAGEPVSAERLAVALWGEDAPARRRQDGPGPRLAAAQGARGPTLISRRRPPATACAAPGRARRRALRAARRRGAARAAPTVTPSARRSSCARRSRSGAARRSPTSPEPFAARRDRAARGAAARARSRRASMPTSPPAPRASCVGELQRSSPSTRCASGSRPADARALPLRPPGRSARDLRRARHTLVDELGSSPARSCARCTRRSCARTVARARRGRRRASARAGTPQPLVGRAAELAWLQERWAARTGAARIVSLVGAARERQDATRRRARRGRSSPRARPCSRTATGDST